MDILTPKGQVSLADEQRLARWLEQRFSFSYIQTPKNSPAAIDAVVVKDNKLLAVAETKCRYDVTLEQFQTSYKNQWLVTWAKVQNMMAIASSLGIPSVGFLFLIKSNTVLIQRLSEPDGKLVPTINLQTSSTQASINGGKALRTNAYIDMTAAKIYQLPA